MWYTWILLYLYFFIVIYLFSPGIIMTVSKRYKLKQVAGIHSVIISLILIMTLNPALRTFSKL